MCFQVNVIAPRGQEKIIDLCDSKEQLKKITVNQLKEKIIQELLLSKGDDFRMIFKAEPLEDSSLLSSCGIRHMSTIQTVLKVPGGL